MNFLEYGIRHAQKVAATPLLPTENHSESVFRGNTVPKLSPLADNVVAGLISAAIVRSLEEWVTSNPG